MRRAPIIWLFAAVALLAVVLYLTPRSKTVHESYPVKLSSDPPGLQNVVRASATVYSGSEPHGEEAFASLRTLGVTTIVSVDAAKPDVYAAGRNGIRYVHIPVGYDGISPSARLSLYAVARSQSGPIYVHCHHGKHRGPAAAAILCLAGNQLSADQAKSLLDLAQTGPEYRGLWRDVQSYQRPTGEVELPKLVAVANVPTMAKSMATLDRYWDDLKVVQASGWKSLPEFPHIEPAEVALMVKESLHEAKRVAKHDEMAKALDEAESLAATIVTELDAKRTDKLDTTMKQLDQSCKRCHVKERN